MATLILHVCLALMVGVSQVVYSSAFECALVVPNNPLTAAGLSTPFLLKSPCSQIIPGSETFVEASIYDPATNTISVYHPLVIDYGTTPAKAPVVPSLPANATVALWFGTNAAGLILIGDVKNATCVNGYTQNAQLSIFGQFAYCNAQQFFQASQNVSIPALGNATDGKVCPTVRDFFIVDDTQS